MTSGKKTRFLDAQEIERGIEEVAQLAAAQGVRVALIGGAALQLLGSDRLTKDIDFAADRQLAGLPALGTLDFGGIKATTPSGVPVDLVLRDDSTARCTRRRSITRRGSTACRSSSFVASIWSR